MCKCEKGVKRAGRGRARGGKGDSKRKQEAEVQRTVVAKPLAPPLASPLAQPLALPLAIYSKCSRVHGSFSRDIFLFTRVLVRLLRPHRCGDGAVSCPPLTRPCFATRWLLIAKEVKAAGADRPGQGRSAVSYRLANYVTGWCVKKRVKRKENHGHLPPKSCAMLEGEGPTVPHRKRCGIRQTS